MSGDANYLFKGLFPLNTAQDDKGLAKIPLVSTPGGDYDHNKLKFELMDKTDESTIDILKAEYLQKKSVELGLQYYKEKYAEVPIDDIPILTAVYQELGLEIPVAKQKEFDRYYKNLHKHISKHETERKRDMKRTKHKNEGMKMIEGEHILYFK